ncbi:MAG: ABC transporter ATP-binding protein [Opitutales bacterium]
MIEASHLKKVYGPIRAVNDVSFRVEAGDVLGFLGPNGAGKSTTMKMVTGFLTPTEGTASIGGHDIREQPIAAKRLFGYLPENGPLYPEMTVEAFLRSMAEFRGFRTSGEQAAAVDRVLELLDLREVRFQTIDTLSKGFRQRVGLAQAVIHDPQALILDEPTDGLDPNQKQQVRDFIAGMASEKAIILSTHILEEVSAICNRVIIIARGSILVDDTPEALLRRHPNHHALRLTLENPEPSVGETLQQVPGIGRVVKDGTSWNCFPAKGERIDGRILEAARERGWTVTRLDPLPVRMDDVFRDLTTDAA